MGLRTIPVPKLLPYKPRPGLVIHLAELERLFRLEWHLKIPKTRRGQIIDLSDIHKAGKTHLRDAYYDMLEKIRKTRYCWFFGAGDLVENATKTSIGEGVYEESLTPEQQMEELSDDLYPLRRKCLGLARGNHEKRSSKTDGHDLINRLCRELRVPRLADHSLHTFVFDDCNVEYTLMVTHGRFGGRTDGGKRRALENLVHIYDADAYIMGHVHGLDTWKHTIYGARDDYFRHFAINGSFLSYIDSYAQEGEYRPGLPGYISTMIGRDGIEFVKNYINWPHVPIRDMRNVKIGDELITIK